MRFDNTILGQVQHVNIRLDFTFESDLANSFDYRSVVRIPLLTLGFTKAVNGLG